ncbi:MAG: hypothetical protein ACJA2W_001124 [Planctomycetota bacterium]|jgi:hypothetical protein
MLMPSLYRLLFSILQGVLAAGTAGDDVERWLCTAGGWGESVRLEREAPGDPSKLVEWWSGD